MDNMMNEESLKKALTQINKFSVSSATSQGEGLEKSSADEETTSQPASSSSYTKNQAPKITRKSRFSREASKALFTEDNKTDFGLDLTSSNWGFVAPNKQYEMLRAVSSNQVAQLKSLLKEGAAVRDIPVLSIDFSKGLMNQGTAFIKGHMSVKNDGYTGTLPSWYKGSAIYLLENLTPALNDEVLMSEFFRSLRAINNERIGTSHINDCCMIEDSLSLVLLCTPDELAILTHIYNKLRFGFNLISVVKMHV